MLPISRVSMQITGYRTDEGYVRTIRPERQQVIEFRMPDYNGPEGGSSAPAQ